jgi:hypothetical protein
VEIVKALLTPASRKEVQPSAGQGRQTFR